MNPMDLIQTNEPRARKRMICIHGGAGVGKTTFSVGLGKALLIPTEEGYQDVPCDHLPLQRSYLELMGTLTHLYSVEEFPYDTIVIDSVDWAEMLIDKSLDDDNFKRDYGKGVAEIGKRFKRLLDAFVALRKKLDVHVVLIAHSQMKRIELPDGSEFDQWQPKLTKKANDLLLESVDEVGYAYLETAIKTVDGQFRDRKVGVSTGRRLVSFVPAASHVAKNRAKPGSNIPSEIDLDPNVYTELFL